MKRIVIEAGILLAASFGCVLGSAGGASAHPHVVSVAHQGTGQVMGNGALHGAFVNGVSCGSNPRAYGLETAHHGPDSGTQGNADGCYQIDGTVPGLDVTSPVIR